VDVEGAAVSEERMLSSGLGTAADRVGQIQELADAVDRVEQGGPGGGGPSLGRSGSTWGCAQLKVWVQRRGVLHVQPHPSVFIQILL
jgi:hypothetical protein